MEYSECCKARAVEDFRENMFDHDDPIEIYTCSKCGNECDLDEDYSNVKVRKLTELQAWFVRAQLELRHDSLSIWNGKPPYRYFEISIPVKYN